MSTTPPVPHNQGGNQPERWWRRVNWSVVLHVPRALVATATAAAGVYLFARWLGQHISGWTAVAICGAAILLIGAASFPLLRKLFRVSVGLWVRVVHRHRSQTEARHRFPRYGELMGHVELLGMRMKDVCRKVGITARVGRWLARHPGVLVHEELIRALCEALILDPDYIRGMRDDYGDVYVERRLFHFWHQGLARAWTWTQIAEAGPETRKVILQSIEAMRWEEIHAQKHGGNDA